MNEQGTGKRREWVKNAAIIFLSVMLVLTFFSNTIMNYSLPQVATQYVERGSITAKVRGTGKVEATDPYEVKLKESRVIAGVAVSKGDVVEKDQVLYYLEDADSEELEAAEKELADLELAYMKGLFGNNVSAEIISKVASGKVDSFSELQTKVTDMQQRLTAAEERVKECQDNVDALSLQSTINSNNATVNTIPEQNEVSGAEQELKDAQTTETNDASYFEREKAKKVAEFNKEITEKKNQISDLETLIASAQSASKDSSGGSTSSGGSSAGGSTTGGGSSTAAGGSAFEEAKTNLESKIAKLKTYGLASDVTLNNRPDGTSSEAFIKSWYNNLDWASMTAENQKGCEAAYGEYRVAVDTYNSIAATLKEYGSVQGQISRLETLEDELTALENGLASVNAMSYTPGDDVENATEKLNEASRVLEEKNNANKQTAVDFQNKLASAEAALKTAQSVYDLLKEEQTEMLSDINAELDLAKASQDIAQKQEEIAKLKENSMGASVKAPVAGTVTSLTYVAGETTKPEETAAVIEIDEKGYTLTLNVTNEQAKKVQVGDVAELQNAWYYDDVQVILSAIKTDPEKPGQGKLLVFNVTGASLTSGQALNISVGQRSAEYELVVPNSAIREDNNGKFILIVESKSSPLGNRYIAARVDVEVLAEDDNNTAISAPLEGYEYVITTATKPVEAGQQVRLNEA